MMNEFKLIPIKEAEQRIGKTIILCGMPELEQDWVSIAFELKRLNSRLSEAIEAINGAIEELEYDPSNGPMVLRDYLKPTLAKIKEAK